MVPTNSLSKRESNHFFYVFTQFEFESLVSRSYHPWALIQSLLFRCSGLKQTIASLRKCSHDPVHTFLLKTRTINLQCVRLRHILHDHFFRVCKTRQFRRSIKAKILQLWQMLHAESFRVHKRITQHFKKQQLLQIVQLERLRIDKAALVDSHTLQRVAVYNSIHLHKTHSESLRPSISRTPCTLFQCSASEASRSNAPIPLRGSKSDPRRRK